METKKITYFEKIGAENTDDTLSAALERLTEGDIKQVVVASISGATALKAAGKFRGTGVEVIAVGLRAGYDKKDGWVANTPKMDEAGVKHYRGIHALSGVERSVKARWGTAGPVLIIADTFRTLGEGTKVCVEVSLMAADGGLLKDENVMAIAGSSKGADTCLILKPVSGSNFFDLAIREIVCKPYTDGIKHAAK